MSIHFRGLSTAKAPAQGRILLQDKKDGFGFARSNTRPAKPRNKGVTEIRGPYYSAPGYGKAVPSRCSGNVKLHLLLHTLVLSIQI
ncbi:hypothetical protein N7462_011551 [Penicillium macrosclerotiorum]|uniref:uncharacterized protein n=1 Tax=Penicillium macrosclerotiorum TaxID=303699 RepID=UPI002548557F|nr:uncharacterized protein N7462_011551 [Penicillium macrosclerotiorum]KAJ5664738.1 hypothetical protein N7462_011551 [Penicillium macrosclerotiorum]